MKQSKQSEQHQAEQLRADPPKPKLDPRVSWQPAGTLTKYERWLRKQKKARAADLDQPLT
jgi:hypothetical protein